jgi:hypothetical protein
MTHVAGAVAKKMDKFFLLAEEKNNLEHKLKRVQEKDNLKIVYRRLIANLERKQALVRAEIDSLEFVSACSSCAFWE